MKLLVKNNKVLAIVKENYTGNNIINAPDDFNLEKYRIENNQVVEIPLDEVKQKKISDLAKENRQYIYNHYDDGTQKTIMALYIKTDDVDKKAKIESVWDWINSVLAYYYEIKSQILLARTFEDIKKIESSMDYAQFDATKPDVTLQDLLGIVVDISDISTDTTADTATDTNSTDNTTSTEDTTTTTDSADGTSSTEDMATDTTSTKDASTSST